MAKRLCLGCGRRVSANASACRRCGGSVTEVRSVVPRQNQGCLAAIGSFIALIFALGVIGSMLPGGSDGDVQTAAVAAPPAPAAPIIDEREAREKERRRRVVSQFEFRAVP